MNRGSFARVIALAMTGALLVTLSPIEPPVPVPIGATPASAANACSDGWREIDLPISFDTRYLIGAVNNSSGPKWLVGGSHTKGQLVYKKTYGVWKRVPSPANGTKGLTGGAALSDTKVELSGYKNSPQMGFTAKLKASKWVAGSGQPSTSTLTDAVIVKGTPWVVGARPSGARLKVTAMRKTAKGWRHANPPSTTGESALTAADVTPGGTLWTVGWKQASSGWRRPYIARRSGGSWKVVQHATLPTGDAVLTDVHFDSGANGWATGYQVNKGTSRYQPILQRWNGSRWNNVSVPFASDKSLIARSVVTDAKGTLWLAGAQLAAGGREVRGWAAHRASGNWTFRVLDTPPELPSELRALTPSSNGAVAVGSIQSTMVALEACRIAVAGNKSKVGISSINARKRIPIGEDGIDGDPADEPPQYVIAGVKPPGFGTPKRPAKWMVKDVSAANDMPTSTKTWDGFVHDLDGNGWDDFFFSRHLALKPRIYLANEDGLRKGSTTAFTIVDRHGCDATDIDGNGVADVFCTTGKVRGTSTGRHELVMNAVGSDPEIKKGSLGAADPLGRGRHATFFDYDRDGDDDLFIGSTKRRVDALPRGNRMYRNTGGQFVPAPWVGLDTAEGSRCMWSGDIDGDGDDDLINCVTDPLDGKASGVRFYRNEKGKMVPRTFSRGITPIGDVDVELADVTGDGRLDLIQLSTSRLRVSKQTDKGFVKIYAASTTDAVAIATGDVNFDREADIYVLRGGSSTNKKDFLLANQDKGKSFKAIKIPQTSKGDADDVLALDFDHNGRTDFVVLNGADKEGPVKLLSVLPRP